MGKISLREDLKAEAQRSPRSSMEFLPVSCFPRHRETRMPVGQATQPKSALKAEPMEKVNKLSKLFYKIEEEVEFYISFTTTARGTSCSRAALSSNLCRAGCEGGGTSSSLTSASQHFPDEQTLTNSFQLKIPLSSFYIFP